MGVAYVKSGPVGEERGLIAVYFIFIVFYVLVVMVVMVFLVFTVFLVVFEALERFVGVGVLSEVNVVSMGVIHIETEDKINEPSEYKTVD